MDAEPDVMGAWAQRAPGAALIAILACVPPHLERSLAPAPPPAAPTVAPSAPAAPATPLGDPSTLPLAPGMLVPSLDALARPAPDWREVAREPLPLAGRGGWLVTLEQPGDAAAVAAVALVDAGLRVVAVFAVVHGGLGASLEVVARHADGPRILLLLRCTRTFRALPGEPGPGTEVTWLVLGIEGGHGFLAMPETRGYDDVRFEGDAKGMSLVARCSYPRGGRVVRPYDPAAMRFGSPDANSAPCDVGGP